MTSDYCIKSGYVAREQPDYFEDIEPSGIIWQPDVYRLAASLATSLACTQLVDLGCGRGAKLIELANAFDIVGLDCGSNIAFCQSAHRKGRWLEVDFEKPDTSLFKRDDLARSIVVCADVVEHLVNPLPLLRFMRQMLSWASLAVISTPERDLCRGVEHGGPPPNRAHVREWNLEEFERLLQSEGLDVRYIGLTRRHTESPIKHTLLAVVSAQGVRPLPVVLGGRWTELCTDGDKISFEFVRGTTRADDRMRP